MSVVTRIQRKSRLGTLIDQPGGLSVGVALAQAEANLAPLLAQSREIVAERVAELARLEAPPPQDQAQARLDQAYGAASAVIDAAGPFGLRDLCAAAAGLCDLIDAAPRDRPFDWRIVTVHARALRLILNLPADADEGRALILENLRQVLDHKLPHDAGAHA